MTTHPDPNRPMRPFLILFGGQSVSLLGSQAVQFAMIWWLTESTGSAAVLVVAGFLGLAPQVVFGPIIGALVDRWNRKRILWLADSLVAAASAALALAFLYGPVPYPVVLAVLFVRALGGAFHAPAMLASTSLMVPEQHLTRIQGLQQAVQGGALIVTAPLGALLVIALPMAAVMAVDVVTAFVALAPLALIAVPQPDQSPVEDGSIGLRSAWRDVASGVTYLREREGHLPLLAMATVVNLCMVPAFTLLPLLVMEQGGGAATLGWLNSAFGIGMIAGGILLGVWGGFRRRVHTTFAALILAGLGTTVLGTATSSLTALIGIAVLGVTIPCINGPIQAVLQSTVAPGFQGRVFTLYASAAGAMTPLGLAIAAPVAELLGIHAWYLAGGIACVVMGVAGFLLRSIERIENSEPVATPTGEFPSEA
jgi:DHA3 family macrolide efflux protein-like MFS transporter